MISSSYSEQRFARSGPAAGATVLGVGALVAGWTGMMVAALAGAAWRARSSDAESTRNRPLSITDPLDGDATVFVSAEQWRTLKANLAQGFVYDEIPASLAQQFRFGLPSPASPSS